MNKILLRVSHSLPVMMDRWKIDFSKPEEGEDEEGDPIPYNIINNYFSIGVVSLSRTFQVLFHGKKIHEGWERHLELRRNHPIPYNIINNYFSIGVVSLTSTI